MVLVNFSLEQAIEAQRGSRCMTLLSLTLALDVGVVGQCHALAALQPPPLGNDPTLIVWEVGWAPGPVWMDAETLTPH